MLRSSLRNDAELRAQLVEALKTDVDDKTTEHGGYFYLNEAGEIQFQSVSSNSLSNGQYQSTQRTKEELALWPTHLHALELDNSVGSGPSGALHGSDADFGIYRGKMAVLLTTAGVKVIEGKKHLSFNVDIYGDYIIDLGVFEAPLPTNEAN